MDARHDGSQDVSYNRAAHYIALDGYSNHPPHL